MKKLRLIDGYRETNKNEREKMELSFSFFDLNKYDKIDNILVVNP